MDNTEETKHKFELLKMARELVNEEYINRRAEDHNKWIADCDVAWKTQGIKLPYPTFVIYPSDADIVAKATSLYNFLKLDNKPEIVQSSPNPWMSPVLSATNPWVKYATAIPPQSISGEAIPQPITAIIEEPVTAAIEELVVQPLDLAVTARPLFALPPWFSKSNK